jgi:hypothetical protein
MTIRWPVSNLIGTAHRKSFLLFFFISSSWSELLLGIADWVSMSAIDNQD